MRISDWSSDVCSSDLSAALVLFTSGSEGEPKGVVLSHDNLLANCRQLAARIDFNPTDSVLNALPVFHSFGLPGGMLLPLFPGVRPFMYPSPLHSRIVPVLPYAHKICRAPCRARVCKYV